MGPALQLVHQFARLSKSLCVSKRSLGQLTSAHETHVDQHAFCSADHNLTSVEMQGSVKSAGFSFDIVFSRISAVQLQVIQILVSRVN
jgi:hypothetical protein